MKKQLASYRLHEREQAELKKINHELNKVP